VFVTCAKTEELNKKVMFQDFSKHETLPSIKTISGAGRDILVVEGVGGTTSVFFKFIPNSYELLHNKLNNNCRLRVFSM